jgi:hypothetical protein
VAARSVPVRTGCDAREERWKRTARTILGRLAAAAGDGVVDGRVVRRHDLSRFLDVRAARRMNDSIGEAGARQSWYATMLPSVFMTLSLHDAVQTNVPESASGIGSLVTANRLFAAGDNAGGIRALEQTWQDPTQEPRLRLWAANALRSRNVAVSGSGANIVLGVVFQVPVDGGSDTVAAYDDGAFRYYNAIRGAVMVEPGAEATVNADAKELVRLASALLPQTPAPDRATISVLTPAQTIVASDDSATGQAISKKALVTVTYAMGLSARQSATE